MGAIIFGALFFARAEGPDDTYVWIYTLIQEADGLSEKGQSSQAALKYLEVQTALKKFQTDHPGWNDKVVNYRLGYVASKLEPLGKYLPSTNAAGLEVKTAVPGPAAETNPLKSLQDEIGRLSSQNTLLEAKLKEALSVQPPATDPRELAKAEEKIKGLQKERDLLKISLDLEQIKISKLMDPVILEEEKRILAEAKIKIAQQAEQMAAMQRENEGLKKELTETKKGLMTPPVPAELAEQLALARATVAALQATNIALRTERILLEERLAEMAKTVQERDDLKRKLEAASKEPGKKGNTTDTLPDNLQKQLELARARLEVYESKPVAYTVDELALFKQPEIKSAAPDANPIKRRASELPAGAGPLIAEAQRAIDGGRFEEAEKKFLQVLRQDEKNVFTLGHLAAVQMEQNRLPDAEVTIKQALAVEPQDPASLFTLGLLKYRQEKYDEALDALSLSAKIIPDEPRTQFFLGRTLIQKGNRAQAEKALRKAIQLKPGWGDAHYSLAVVYATQQPPFKELAQWHYQKAISGGFPRNLEFEKAIEEKKSALAAP